MGLPRDPQSHLRRLEWGGGGGVTNERAALPAGAPPGDGRDISENYEGRKTEIPAGSEALRPDSALLRFLAELLLAYIDTLEVYDAAPKPLEAPGRRKLEREREGSVRQ